MLLKGDTSAAPRADDDDVPQLATELQPEAPSISDVASCSSARSASLSRRTTSEECTVELKTTFTAPASCWSGQTCGILSRSVDAVPSSKSFTDAARRRAVSSSSEPPRSSQPADPSPPDIPFLFWVGFPNQKVRVFYNVPTHTTTHQRHTTSTHTALVQRVDAEREGRRPRSACVPFSLLSLWVSRCELCAAVLEHIPAPRCRRRCPMASRPPRPRSRRASATKRRRCRRR